MSREIFIGYGERLRALRKELNMTQIEFAELIKTTNGHISDMEKERKNLSERSVKIICDEFKVNEVWLRTGEGQMFMDVPTAALDRLAEQYKLSDDAKYFVKSFIELDEKEMNVVLKFMYSLVTKNEAKSGTVVSEAEQRPIDKWEAETDRAQAILDAQKVLDKEHNKDPKKEDLSS